MGMYTGIRFKGYIKPEFREKFEAIAIDGEWENSEYELFKTFGRNRRSSFIPMGALSYMPDEWEENEIATDGFERAWVKDTGYWVFQCSLKNYENEIEQWLEMLPYFIEKIVHLEYFYEEMDYSKQYDIVDGEVRVINYAFKDYRYKG